MSAQHILAIMALAGTLQACETKNRETISKLIVNCPAQRLTITNPPTTSLREAFACDARGFIKDAGGAHR